MLLNGRVAPFTVSELLREDQLGGRRERKILHFTNTNISFTLPLSLWYAMINILRVRKLSKFKITGVYSRKAVQRKTATW